MPAEHSELILTLDPTKADWSGSLDGSVAAPKAPESEMDRAARLGQAGVLRYHAGGKYYVSQMKDATTDFKVQLPPNEQSNDVYTSRIITAPNTTAAAGGGGVELHVVPQMVQPSAPEMNRA